MSTQADPYRDWDVAYVLGSLSPAERREFEGHLSECPSCVGEVGILTGMPGILSAVHPGQAVELLDPAGAVPDTVPPRQAHSSQRRGRIRFAVGVVAAAAAGAALILSLQSGSIASPAEKAPRTSHTTSTCRG